jgi:hypothetical protein
MFITILAAESTSAWGRKAMSATIKAPEQARPALDSFWARYFSETPTCTCEACGEVAIEVDPFFPYLDDLNRCAGHRGESEGGPAGSLS